MARQLLPGVRELSRRDIDSILARNLVGRLVFSCGDRLDVQPIGFVYHRGSIYGRTAPSSRLARMAARGADVAFEVDEIETTLRWRSVIVHGTVETLPMDDLDHEERDRVAGLLRKVIPATFTEDDPVPDRSEVVRIRIEEVTGRAMD
jgi:nitroimidazol reductase NimA-like FMN-containing flavoprotein (pyridoxamine 5'-phosphate oxidase superfamily)